MHDEVVRSKELKGRWMLQGVGGLFADNFLAPPPSPFENLLNPGEFCVKIRSVRAVGDEYPTDLK